MSLYFRPTLIPSPALLYSCHSYPLPLHFHPVLSHLIVMGLRLRVQVSVGINCRYISRGGGSMSPIQRRRSQIIPLLAPPQRSGLTRCDIPLHSCHQPLPQYFFYFFVFFLNDLIFFFFCYSSYLFYSF